eukprot:764510-Hanusia_phi.AAC.1
MPGSVTVTRGAAVPRGSAAAAARRTQSRLSDSGSAGLRPGGPGRPQPSDRRTPSESGHWAAAALIAAEPSRLQ